MLLRQVLSVSDRSRHGRLCCQVGKPSSERYSSRVEAGCNIRELLTTAQGWFWQLRMTALPSSSSPTARSAWKHGSSQARRTMRMLGGAADRRTDDHAPMHPERFRLPTYLPLVR